ncbi:MAG: DNA-binding response regulator [Rhodanobacter sp. 68-29]|uniref:response regulator transcription factor n=1 Tax=Rhodanobacter sp. PCA2 TaxID=2006117 RepID=UPI00086ED9D7|nr:response regulator transcription factor [Rhodanobacter sp. PCA2]MBA2078210.1 DNA-binding response regulator [Rhodanobacter sp. PCA2]MBN8923281.1 response regulator transcription factor [Rhodanobacter sp.]ODU75179.1 MAG: DNA-binding response regulator [Rhodanobacter sp. SCN 69-32]OJY59552.1 MAG: DNA-binding response regulator [Rhodanobacter sp. 68-29]
MRIVICDDHPVVVMGVKAILASQGNAFEVVGEAHGGQQLLQLLGTTACDLVITDFSMPGENRQDDGLPMLRRLREAWPELPVIVLTMIHNAALLQGMLKLGVQGVVDKTGMTTELLRAVRAIAAGRNYVSTHVQAASNHGRAAEVDDQQAATVAVLSVREAEVVRLYAQGLSVTQIAETVRRSVKTVSKQKNDAMRKLGLESNRELYEFARASGLLA